ncbi:MAG TPA: tRNA (adenosine(37)-N6)-threonylcarbamoyltransferase complex dimerization subunit type 1 TsaB, partial [Elusimicrobia bacterium]|nr:tRNA (adenosine(37)-N6)-threonylcarbamoyltransferase complex dimerization subunit type 1 TsaB [Elusimicrobiota bacterium]
MKILAIETSSKICSAALLEDEEIRAEYNLNLGLRHSEFLFPLIENVLKDSEWQVRDLEGIAVDEGPGSFTGIRIGLASARTLAQLLNIPLVGIVSLDVLTENISPNDSLVSPIIDALSGEVYTSLYQCKKNKWQRLVPYQICEINSWLDNLIT